MRLTVMLICFFLSGCVKTNIFSDPGPEMSDARMLPGFIQINLKDKIDLVIHPDTLNKAVVEGPRDFVNSIVTEVRDSQVTIRSTMADGLQRPDFHVTVHLYTKSLLNINYQSAGAVNCADTVRTSYFNFLASTGTGAVHLKLRCVFAKIEMESDMADLFMAGGADSAYAHIAALSSFDARDFAVKRMEIDQASIRPAYVNAVDLLRARLWFKGDLYYRGSPQVIKAEHGDGRLKIF